MNQKIKLLLQVGIINTIRFNTRYFGMSSLLKPKVLIARNVVLKKTSGQINIVEGKRISNIGFSTNLAYSGRNNRTVFYNDGVLNIYGHISIFNGSSLIVRPNAELSIGDNFSMSQCSVIQAYKKITIGKDCTVSWDCLIMDSDTHPILDLEKKNILNSNMDIVLGDHIWLCSGVKVFKGSNIPKNCVVGAGSVITKKLEKSNAVYVNNTAIKENITFDTSRTF